MKTAAKRNSRLGIGGITLALAIFATPNASRAQGSVSKEEFAKRQKAFQERIAAFEASKAQQEAEGLRFRAEREKNRKANADSDRALVAGRELAAESPAITKAKAQTAALDARVRRNATPEVRVRLDPPKPSRKGGVPVPVEGNGPAPGPKPVPTIEKKKSGDGKRTDVEIAAKSSTFDANTNLAIFEGNVVVSHPEFDLWCDQLIVFMKKGDKKKDDDKEGDDKEGDSTIDKAIATGKKVIVRKRTEDGDIQIGQSRKVTFDGASGDVFLEDWPQVQRGYSLIEAKEQGTVIQLKRDGQMKVNGQSHTKIIPPEKEKGKEKENKKPASTAAASTR